MVLANGQLGHLAGGLPVVMDLAVDVDLLGDRPLAGKQPGLGLLIAHQGVEDARRTARQDRLGPRARARAELERPRACST